MKRILLAFSALLFCLIYWSCQKNETINMVPKFQDPFVAQAVQYLKAQINDENFQALDFGSLQMLKDTGVTTGIFIVNKDKMNRKFIFIEKIAGEYRGNWVEVENKDSANTGILTTTSFDSYLKTQVTFLNGRAIKIVKTAHNLTKTLSIKYNKVNILELTNETSNQIRMSAQSRKPADTNWVTLVDVTVIMPTDASPNILYSIYWLSGTSSSTNSYTTLPQSSTGGISHNLYSLNLFSGNNPIGDINDYFKCFTNVAGSNNKYKVTICVDQPVVGTRNAWVLSSSGVQNSSSGSNPVNVGHTFLILTEVTPTGTTTRNVGFYPQSNVDPYSPIDKGQLNNNEQHTYNIALTVDINNSQFFNILNFVTQVKSSGQNYDLNNYNCTSFGIRACLDGDIYLPSTIGSWTGGSGNNPGDLGEDIRAMSLQSNMTRTTTERDHPNQGNCHY